MLLRLKTGFQPGAVFDRDPLPPTLDQAFFLKLEPRNLRLIDPDHGKSLDFQVLLGQDKTINKEF